VFIGGGGANLRTIIQTADSKLKFTGRIVINAILLETAATAVTELKALGYKDIDVVNISVAKGRQVPSGTMMMARNPTTVISATKL
jgi:cobalt-precorrin-6B (C15)-methyltransferase